MSDMSQGPGWWIASDGKWYPPHLHPAVQPPPAAAVAGSGTYDDAALATAGTGGADLGSVDTGSGGLGGTGHGGFDSGATGLGGTDVGGRGFGGTDFGAGGFEGADFGVSASGRSAGRSRSRVAAVVGSVVVLLLVSVGAFVVFASAKSASAEVVDAVHTALADNSARLTLSISGTSGGSSIDGTGTGSIDFARNALQMQMSLGSAGQQLTMQAIYLGGVMYVGSSIFSQFAPGKSWISIDFSALGQAAGQDPTAQGLATNPALDLQMLAQQGNTVVPTGPSTVGGVAVNGYSVTIDPAGVANEFKKAGLPSWMQKAAARSNVHDIAMDVFVDHAGLLRAIVVQTSTSGGSAGASDFTVTLDLSDYGTPVAVTAPPADQVETFQQLLQSVATQSGA